MPHSPSLSSFRKKLSNIPQPGSPKKHSRSKSISAENSPRGKFEDDLIKELLKKKSTDPMPSPTVSPRDTSTAKTPPPVPRRNSTAAPSPKSIEQAGQLRPSSCILSAVPPRSPETPSKRVMSNTVPNTSSEEASESESSDRCDSQNSETEDGKPKIVWKRNAEAEKIRKMLLEGDITSPQKRRGTVSADALPSTLLPSPSSSPRSNKEEKLKKLVSKSGSIPSHLFSRHSSKKDLSNFSITRADDESQAGLDSLDKEFAEFSGKPPTPKANVGSPTPPPTEKLAKRTQIVLEIRASERSYCSTLEALKDKFCAGLILQSKNGAFDIPDARIKQIFSNISLINNINQMLFKEIDQRVNIWSDTQTIGDIFKDIIPYLKIYDSYGNNYDTSLEILKDCQKNLLFANAVSQIESTLETNIRLEAMLIAPIQRLPRYILLLSDLQKNTPEDHPDWILLNDAIPAMQSVADHVDKNIHQAKSKQKLVELSSGGASSLLLAHRTLISEIEVRCENKKKPTAFYLFNDLLVHLSANKAKHKPNLTNPSAQWPLTLIWFQYPSVDSVQITGPTSDVYIFKLTSQESRDFVTALNTAVDADLKKQAEKQNLNCSQDITVTVETPARFGTYKFQNLVEYTGDWVNGKMHGKGKWTYKCNEYTGEFRENLKHGNGEMVYFSGNIYSGEWENDTPHGKGVLVHPSSEKYEGEFKQGAKNGYGTMTFSSGDVFDGYWKDNKPDGQGTFNFHNGTTYAGNFLNGRFHNYGVLSCTASGTKYEGEWANGFKEGNGRMEYQDGSSYDGCWKGGLREGKGTFTSKNEGVYTGEWQGDLKHGKGTMEFFSGNVYDGTWKQGMFNGKGKMIYSAGSINFFEGEWAQNMKNGKGVMHYSNGDVFEGQFKDDLMHGLGIYSYANGVQISGKWTFGVHEGKTTISLPGDTESMQGTVKENIWVPNSPTDPTLHFHTVPDLRFDPW